ncbi:18853_t:CDS:10 [Entrophospora sp. SA101]|nr:18853_t:CDS:10 [Entrophospora sp. SA101]
MWKLETSGRVVEEELYKLSRGLEFEHGVHSFIVDVDDELIKQHFSEAERLETENECKTLKEIRKTIIEPDERFDMKYDQDAYHDLDYIRFALCALVREIEYGGLKGQYLEAWYNCHVWDVIIDQGFSGLKETSVIRGESTSTANAERKNAHRTDTNTWRKFGHRGDWILRRIGNGERDEYGIGEAGKLWFDDHGMKFLKETCVKSPKCLKDMLLKLMKKVDWDKELCKKLQTVGITHADKQFSVPDIEENFPDILQILAAVLIIKVLLFNDDVKLSHRKDTDVRGANKRVVKKILRKTVEVACKTILHYPKDDGTSESKKFQAKLAILNAIQCKYIIKFYGISNVNSHNALIFGWAEKGNLKDLYNTHYIDWVTKLKISYDVIRGLLFMHNGEILHHDVKCENILIDENGSAKVSNFELSRNLSGETTILSDLNDYIRWMAPEKMGSKTQRYNLYCEMFSFGMFLWELAYQQIPYNEMNVTSISDHVLSGQRESIKIGVHNTEIQQVLIQIINRAWEHSPYSRPSFAEITDELAELWKSFESIKYVAKFIAKDEVSSDEIQHYNIDEDSDFER